MCRDTDRFFSKQKCEISWSRGFPETSEEVDIDQSFLRCVSHNTTSSGH